MPHRPRRRRDFFFSFMCHRGGKFNLCVCVCVDTGDEERLRRRPLALGCGIFPVCRGILLDARTQQAVRKHTTINPPYNPINTI